MEQRDNTMRGLIVTGASSGIGKEIAALFLEQDWRVFNISRSPCDLAGVVNYAVDLGRPGWEKAVMPALAHNIQAAKQFCVVHNAVSYRRDQIDGVDIDRFREVIEVNIVAPMILNQALIPVMPETSSVIYIGSTLSEKAVPNAASYVISKHALVGMMRATCQDTAGKGIHTVCICPGFTDTKMLRAHLREDVEKLNALKLRVSHHRLIDPEEIASLTWYCANNPVVNGAVIQASLGQVER